MKTIDRSMTAQKAFAMRNEEVHAAVSSILDKRVKLAVTKAASPDWGYVGSLTEALRLLERAEEIMAEITR